MATRLKPWRSRGWALWVSRRRDRLLDPVAIWRVSWACASLALGMRAGWAVDMVVTGIALLFTAGWIVMQRPEPFYALITGTGFGALGAGIIAIALKWVRRMDALVGLSDEEVPPPPARPETATAIKDALRQLHDVPLPDEQKPSS